MTATLTAADLARVGNLEVRMSVELGRCTMSIAELLALGEGAVVALEAAVSAPLDVYANGRLFARGEVVEIEERFGLRLTEIAGRDGR